MQWLKACLNYKVLIGIAAVIVLAYIFAPQLARYSWLLLALACPISMIAMMAGMQHMQDKPNSPKQVFVCSECRMQYADKEKNGQGSAKRGARSTRAAT
jgi:hypothetical protein